MTAAAPAPTPAQPATDFSRGRSSPDERLLAEDVEPSSEGSLEVLRMGLGRGENRQRIGGARFEEGVERALIVRGKLQVMGNWRGMVVTQAWPLNGIFGGYEGHPSMAGGRDKFITKLEEIPPGYTP